jgi:hypothetical protein
MVTMSVGCARQMDSGLGLGGVGVGGGAFRCIRIVGFSLPRRRFAKINAGIVLVA